MGALKAGGISRPRDLGKFLRLCHSENLGIALDESVTASQLQSLPTYLLSFLISAWVENGLLCRGPEGMG